MNNNELIVLLRLGHKGAFEAIYKTYASPLYRYARRSIATKEDCEEIVQEVFVSLWQRRESLSHVTALEPYLFRSVKYMVVRYFQKKAVQQKYAEHFKFFEAIYDSIEYQEHDPTSRLMLLENGIAKLPERIRQAVRLRLQGNLSNSQIADQMKIERSAVENYMVRALKILRATYRDMGEVGQN
jgi:RNA polymerase sigma-70 factor (ECF subfamily)